MASHGRMRERAVLAREMRMSCQTWLSLDLSLLDLDLELELELELDSLVWLDGNWT